MNQKTIWAIALAAVILVAVVIYAAPAATDQEGTVPVTGAPDQTVDSTENQVGAETTPDMGGAAVPDPTDAEEATNAENQGSQQTGTQNNQGSATGNQTGSQGSQGGSGNQSGSQGSQTGSDNDQSGSGGDQGGSDGNQTGSQENPGGSQGGTEGGGEPAETTPGETVPDAPTQPEEDEESGVLSPA